MILPARGGQDNYQDTQNGVTSAATETQTINGVTYSVFNLTGNNTDNCNIIAQNNTDPNGNYKYVMTDNWGLLRASKIIPVAGNHLIWDLNGYTFTVPGAYPEEGFFGYIRVQGNSFEIIDSATTKTGRAVSLSDSADAPLFVVDANSPCQQVTVSGGTIDGQIHFHNSNCALAINGGVLNGGYVLFDGHELTSLTGDAYEVIKLTDDYDTNKAKLAKNGSTGNYKYVMTTDLDLTSTAEHPERAYWIYGNSVIWDLHGHTLTLTGWQVMSDTDKWHSYFFVHNCQMFEIADSSATRSGKVVSRQEVADFFEPTTTVTLSGGTLVGTCEFRFYSPSTNLVITGGNWGNISYKYDNVSAAYPITTVAPYMAVTYDSNGHVIAASGYPANNESYQVIFLDDDFASNSSKLAPANATGNYLYVMTADLDLTAAAEYANRQLVFYGDSVIFDLNGYTLTTSGWTNDFNGVSWLNVVCRTFELTDSSIAHSGKVKSDNILLGASNNKTETITISGGNLIAGMCQFRITITTLNIQFLGGNWGKVGYRAGYNYPASEYVAPYLKATYDNNGHVTSAVPYDQYAVSTSNLYSGAYNYVYGLAWDIDVWQMQKLTIPGGKPYYLWARNGDSWYQCLGEYHHYVRVPGFTAWEKFTMADTWEINSNSTVTLNGRAGVELLRVPVKVMPNTNYTLTFDAVINDFNPYGQYTGLGICVATPECASKQSNFNSMLTADPEKLGIAYVTPNYNGQITISFNSGERDTVYIVIDGGCAGDNQSVVFTFNNLVLQSA